MGLEGLNKVCFCFGLFEKFPYSAFGFILLFKVAKLNYVGREKQNNNNNKKITKERKNKRRGLTGTPQQLMPIKAGGFKHPVCA